MKNYFAFKQNVAGDCGILKYEPPYPPASDILRLYLASEVDARITELERQHDEDTSINQSLRLLDIDQKRRIAELEKMLRKAIDIIESWWRSADRD